MWRSGLYLQSRALPWALTCQSYCWIYPHGYHRGSMVGGDTLMWLFEPRPFQLAMMPHFQSISCSTQFPVSSETPQTFIFLLSLLIPQPPAASALHRHNATAVIQRSQHLSFGSRQGEQKAPRILFWVHLKDHLWSKWPLTNKETQSQGSSVSPGNGL